MSVLSYRCPNTSKEVRTGIESDATGLAKLRNLKVAVDCPHCQDGHIVTADSMFFSFELPGSTAAARAAPELDR
jgi:hypothetical protein